MSDEAPDETRAEEELVAAIREGLERASATIDVGPEEPAATFAPDRAGR